MAELHILLVVDTEDGSVRLGSLDEAPVHSDASVFDDPDWRRPTEEEFDLILLAETKVAYLIDTLVIDKKELE